MNKAIVFGLILVVALGIVGYVAANITYSNQEARLHNLFDTRYKDLQAVYDNTWKIISQQAQVAEQYKDAFQEIYPELITRRYGDPSQGVERDPLFLFIREHNPQFDIGLYAKLSDSISAERTNFTRRQELVNSVWQQHENLLEVFPSSWFLRGVDHIDWEPITSDQTKQVFESGVENDISVFGE